MSYAQTLLQFQKHLLQMEDAPSLAAPERLQAYRYMYQARLGKTVEADYPALSYYLGKNALRAEIAAYILSTPSHHFNLDRYAIGFAAFFCARHTDVLAQELARYESAIAETTMDAQGTDLSRHLACTYPIHAYHEAVTSGETPPPPSPAPQWLSITRTRHRLERRVISQHEYRP